MTILKSIALKPISLKLLLMMITIDIVVTYVINHLNGHYGNIFGNIFEFVLSAASVVFVYMITCLSVKPDEALLPFNFFLFVKYILACALYGLIVAAGLIVFIIPGLIAFSRLSFFPYALIEDDTRIDECFKKSWSLTQNCWIKVLLGLLLLISLVFLFGYAISFFFKEGSFVYIVMGSILGNILSYLMVIYPFYFYKKVRDDDGNEKNL